MLCYTMVHCSIRSFFSLHQNFTAAPLFNLLILENIRIIFITPVVCYSPAVLAPCVQFLVGGNGGSDRRD